MGEFGDLCVLILMLHVSNQLYLLFAMLTDKYIDHNAYNYPPLHSARAKFIGFVVGMSFFVASLSFIFN